MYINNLITRTGLDRGVVLTGSGNSITDTNGAGNRQVGSYYFDFSSMFNNIADQTPNLPLLDNEFSVVIADGRYLENENSGADDEFLLDEEDSPEDMDGAMVDDATRMLTVNTVSIDMRFVGPSFAEAALWRLDLETGDDIQPFGGGLLLGDFLDELNEGINEQGAGGDINLWNIYASHLRWPLHWALMVIDCTSVVDQGASDYQKANSTISVAQSPMPVVGPRSILLQYGTVAGLTGTDAGGMRLWSPHEGSQGVRFVARGEREYKYQYRLDRSTDAPPNATYDTDLSDDVAQPIDSELMAVHDDASSMVEGNNIHLRLRLKRKVKLRDDQLLVFTVQTGRCRLMQASADGLAGDIVIGGPQFLEGRNGPALRLYHHAVRATGYSR